MYGALREWQRERIDELSVPLPASAMAQAASMRDQPCDTRATLSGLPSARLEPYTHWRTRQAAVRSIPRDELARAAPRRLAAASAQCQTHDPEGDMASVVTVSRPVPAVVRSQGLRALEARARHNAAALVLGRRWVVPFQFQCSCVAPSSLPAATAAASRELASLQRKTLRWTT